MTALPCLISFLGDIWTNVPTVPSKTLKHDSEGPRAMEIQAEAWRDMLRVIFRRFCVRGLES